MTELLDLSSTPTVALVDFISSQLDDHSIDPDSYAYLHELASRVDADVEQLFVLPVAVSEAIRATFGPGSRTFTAVTKRVRFSYKVWQGKYGPWTPEQSEYAEALCIHAIHKGVRLADQHKGARQPYVYKQFDRVLHHENTDAGFKRRRGEMVDITAHLEELSRV